MSVPSLAELMEQKATIEKQIAEAQRRERSEAIANVRALMAQFGLTLADIGGKSAAATRSGPTRKVAVKYRDPATQQTWSGRGLQPKWLKAALEQGRTLSDFKA